MFNYSKYKIAHRRIKDRGIRWKEAFHERSYALKQRFESNLGPGSYHRWEGYDSTTSSNYFIIVGPAVTKQGEKKFFAGIKKMPKDPNVTPYAPYGEYFSTILTALSHAQEKWGIPFPQNNPNYDIQDLEPIEIPRHVK